MSQIIRVKSEGFDDRFYHFKDSGVYAPSVTYVLSVAFPMAPHLYKWVGEVGYEEAKERKNKAGEEGAAVHQAIDFMLKGEPQHRDNFNYKEKKCLKAFLDWWEVEKPILVQHETAFIQENMGYGGTIDGVYRLKRDNYKDLWVIDYKTSRGLYDYHKIQIKAYQHATLAPKAALLHLGNGTKAGWSFCEVEDERYFEMWKQCLSLFKIMKPDAKPISEEFPEFFQVQLNNSTNENHSI